MGSIPFCKRIFLLISFLILLIAFSSKAIGAIIPITVSEEHGIQRNNAPVTSGIPIRKEYKIFNTQNLQIINSSGEPLPAQFKILARHNGKVDDLSKETKVLLVDFLTDIQANGKSTFYLKNDFNGTQGQPLLATEDQSHISISTDRLLLKIKKVSPQVFDEVFLDGTQLINNDSQNSIQVTQNNTLYTSNNTSTTASIEENGHLRCVVKTTGYFQDSNGNRLLPKDGANGLSFTTRLTAYKDKPFVKIDVTLENENLGWSDASIYMKPVQNIFIDSLSVVTSLNLDASKVIKFDSTTDTFNSGTYTLKQDHLENSINNEDGNFIFSVSKNGAPLLAPAPKRFEGGLHLRDGKKGVFLSSRWFWQNWPKGITVTDNTIQYFLWPKQEQPHRILGGIWKTHSLLYNFHSELPENQDFVSQFAPLKKRLVARAESHEYTLANWTGTIPPTQINTQFSYPQGESLQEAIDVYNRNIKAKFNNAFSDQAWTPETWFTLREKRPIFLDIDKTIPANWYGWLTFGDTPGAPNCGYSGQHYDWSFLTLLHSIRFSDSVLRELGEELVSHNADIIIIHDPLGSPSEGLKFHGAHRYEFDALLSYNNSYSTSKSAQVRGSTHFWNKGLILQYYLTGDERFRDVAEQTGFHLINHYIDFQQCSTQECGGFETRHQTRAIEGLVAVYNLTGETKYLDAAFDIFKNGVLTWEGNLAGSSIPGGWMDATEGNIVRDWCGGKACDAHVFFDGLSIIPCIYLYDSLINTGSTTQAALVKDHLIRKANWAKDTLYTNWEGNSCGTYKDNGASYFPYTIKIDWEQNWTWKDSKFADGSDSVMFSSLFAFMFRDTKQLEWLNLARFVFKDYFFYGTGGSWVTTKFTGPSLGFPIVPGAAWAKAGRDYTRTLFYLTTEYEYSLNINVPIIKSIKIQ